MGRCVQLLCGDDFDGKEGIYWLVGSRSMPSTIVSTVKCLRFLNASGDPDVAAESDDLRALLPRGLEVIGAAVLDNADELSTIKRACGFAFRLISHVSVQSDKPAGVFAACLAPGSSCLQYHYCLDGVNGKSEAVDDVVHLENPADYLWTNMCLLQCKLQLKVPLYAKSFASPQDYTGQLLTALENILEDLQSPKLSYYVEGFTRNPRKLLQIMVRPGLKNQPTKCEEPDTILCSDLSLPASFKTAHGMQMPCPTEFKLMLHQSSRKEKALAPIAEYIPSSAGTTARSFNFDLDVLCLVHHQLSLRDASSSFVLPAIMDQLSAIKNAASKEHMELEKVRAFHFCPPGFVHPVSCVYNMSYGESELSIMDYRRMLHSRLSLPLDRPLLRVANALSFCDVVEKLNGRSQGKSRLSDVHQNLLGSGVVGGCSSVVEGSYEYYHYLQDNLNDNGWGCAYRSLQTIISWFRLQHYTTVDVPTHRKIQEILVEVGDKDPSFIGSEEWIGAIELSFVLDNLLGVSSKILNVRSGAELPEKCRELSHHFKTQGTPIMIGGGVLAYTLLGVDYNDTTGESAFLILDPHYTGGEDLKTIWNGGWCGWKKAISAKGEEFFLRNKFYNLLLPQRPNTI